MTRAEEVINNCTNVKKDTSPEMHLYVSILEGFVENLFTNPEMLLYNIEKYPDTLKYLEKQLH